MAKPTGVVDHDQPLTLVNLPPGRAQIQFALVIVVASLGAVFFTVGLLSNIQLGRLDAFFPAYGTALFINDLITAVLLYNQFAMLRTRALLVISSGYLFAALMIVPLLLTFPGVFTAGGLLGAGPQSTNWLYIVRYAAFPTFVVVYAVLKNADFPARSWEGRGNPILLSVVISVIAVGTVTALIISGDAYMPRISIDPIHYSNLSLYIGGSLIFWDGLAVVLLWRHHRSVLDLWLMVVVYANAIEIYLILFPGLARFSAGWYGGRIFGLVSSILVLFVLLHEIATLHERLLHAVQSQRREREARMMTGDAISASIAHEVKQPLGAIIANANAGLNWLNRPEPELNEVRQVLRHVVIAGRRADAVIENIRAQFRKDARKRVSLDMDDVIREALAVVRDKLTADRIIVLADPNRRLPRIVGEQTQLQQVLVNLITNAIESMASDSGDRVLYIRSGIHLSGCLMVSVEDTGKGLEPGVAAQIFEPLFTTKNQGMGMGLSICRAIIEAHEGQLWVTTNRGRGAIFNFTVPLDPASTS